jgi:tetratricopeptide (TPR) repeat protein
MAMTALYAPTAAEATGVVLEAYGDPDDHLRLSTLLAHAVARLVSTPTTRGTARRLTDDRGPRSWRDRRSDFVDLVDLLPADGRIVLRDPDAFGDATTGAALDDWDDASLLRERADFLSIVLKAIARDAIRVERTAPDPRVSAHLDAAPDAPIADPADEWALAVAPDGRPALAFLLAKGHLSSAAVDELLEDGIGPELDRHLIRLAYDQLRPATREVAHRLAVLRGEQPLNGAAGPFPARAGEDHATPRAEIDELVECGFIQRSARPGAFRMPRIVRHVLDARADALDPDRLEGDHRWVAEKLSPRSTADLDALVECHHHAVRGLDLARAVETASFYATDLREIGIRLSAKQRWTDAAEAYRVIVTRFDRTDAYAWEYLGYNLARADAEQHKDEILGAYERAFENDARNPLYHGRWLGFRGRLGADIDAEFERGLTTYRYRGTDRFACEVLKALRRGGRETVAQRLVSANRSLLKYPEVRRAMGV